MTVACPRCGTRYRPPARVAGGATFRCARCRHVFAPDDDAAAEPVALDADDEAPVEEEPEDQTFTFGDDEAEEHVPPPEPRKRRARRAASDDKPADDTAARGTSPARFALRALLGVTLGYAVLSIYLYTHPEATRDLLAHVPLIGTQLSETHLHPGAIQLADVHGEFQRVQGDALVFVVSGTAINNAPVPVTGIQVQGRITGREEQRQVVFCGAAPRDVRELSVREIALLQTLEPPKDWSLAPGEQATFLVAFAQPPVPLREFTAEVVAVRGVGRRGGGPADETAAERRS